MPMQRNVSFTNLEIRNMEIKLLPILNSSEK